MRILLLGSSSPIASAYGAFAREQGHDITTVGRRDADLSVDLRRPEQLPEIEQPADVVVAVWGSLGADTTEGLRAAHEVNAGGALTAATLAERSGAARLVLISTIYAAQPERYTGPRAYPVTKRHGEELAAIASNRAGIHLTVLRPSHVYGADPVLLERQPVLALALSRSRAGEEFVLRGERDALRDYLHISDLVAMIDAAAQRSPGGVVDCVSPRTTTLREMVELSYRIRSREPRLRWDRTAPSVPDMPEPDRTRSAAALGVHATLELVEGLRRLIESETPT